MDMLITVTIVSLCHEPVDARGPAISKPLRASAAARRRGVIGAAPGPQRLRSVINSPNHNLMSILLKLISVVILIQSKC